MKKDRGSADLRFEPTADIVARSRGEERRPVRSIVGFAAETTNVAQNALTKLRAKGVDLLVVNDVVRPSVGFEHPTNEVVILDRDEHVESGDPAFERSRFVRILARVASLLSQGAS